MADPATVDLSVLDDVASKLRAAIGTAGLLGEAADETDGDMAGAAYTIAHLLRDAKRELEVLHQAMLLRASRPCRLSKTNSGTRGDARLHADHRG